MDVTAADAEQPLPDIVRSDWAAIFLIELISGFLIQRQCISHGSLFCFETLYQHVSTFVLLYF